MEAYLGINILMGIHVLPDIYSYWSSNEYLGVEAIKKIMSRTRFVKLNHYMHLNNNKDEIPYGTAGYDSLFKVQHALHIIKKTFSEFYRPGKNVYR